MSKVSFDIRQSGVITGVRNSVLYHVQAFGGIRSENCGVRFVLR